MTLWTGAELNQLFDANLPETFAVSGVSIDSRTAKPGDLYVALHGVHSDGHLYVHAAVQKGCVGVLVDRLIPGLPQGISQIIVPDTLAALEMLGQAARQRTKAKIIAITGSVGKTSTKEMLRKILANFGPVSWSLASYNNHWGVPLSLARLPADVDFAVFEVGMNHPGEIEPLACQIRPHVAAITLIAPAHLGHMGSIEAIAQEKSMIFKGLLPDGAAIFCADSSFDAYLNDQAHHCKAAQILTYGLSKNADFQLVAYALTHNGTAGHVTARYKDQQIGYDLSIAGAHQAQNSVLCLAVLKALNLNWKAATPFFKNMEAVQGRGVFHEIILDASRRILLIDDAYNANLASMKASIDMLVGIEPQDGGRRIVVFGEMLELANEAESHHQQVAQYINDAPITCAYFIGGAAVQYGFSHLNLEKQGLFVHQATDLEPTFSHFLQNNDVVLIKGSKGSCVNILVDCLLARNIASIHPQNCGSF